MAYNRGVVWGGSYVARVLLVRMVIERLRQEKRLGIYVHVYAYIYIYIYIYIYTYIYI